MIFLNECFSYSGGFSERKLFISETLSGCNFCLNSCRLKTSNHRHHNVPSVRAGVRRNRYKKETWTQPRVTNHLLKKMSKKRIK